ncbi:MAG: hypothetical protein AAF721_01675 [Myxococcota bacterium]
MTFVRPNPPTGPVALPAPDPAGFIYVASVDADGPSWNSDLTVDDFKLYDAALVP